MATITASVLYSFVSCPHRIWLDAVEDPAKRDPVSPFVELLWERGSKFERDTIEGLALLATPLPNATLPFSQLLERARRPTVRIWAEHSPFELKDQLKARGYRWNADATQAPRSWYIDVDEANHQAEIAFLAKEIYQREISPLTRKITAYDRFSDRV